MGLLQKREKRLVEKEFARLQDPVKLIMFTQETECQYCQHTHELLEELGQLSDKLSVEIYDFVQDKEKVAQYQIDKIPATVVEGKKDAGVRFFGIPSGYEFSTLMEAITQASSGTTDLSEKTKALIAKIITPLHIQVFVTPT